MRLPKEVAYGALSLACYGAGDEGPRGHLESDWRTTPLEPGGRDSRELRLHGISSYEAANAYLEGPFRPWHNHYFTVAAAQSGTAFVACHRIDLDRIFALHYERPVAADNIVPFGRVSFQLHRSPLRVSFATCRVKSSEHLDETSSIGRGPHTLGHYAARGPRLHRPRRASASTGKTPRTDHVLPKADSFTCY